MRGTSPAPSPVVLLVLVLLAAAPASAVPDAEIPLPDGRVLRGEAIRRTKDAVVLDTAFGPLRVARARLKAAEGEGTTAPPEEKPPDESRETRTRWWRIQSDLSPARDTLYREHLDGFVEWMIGVYHLDRERLLASAPFSMQVYRSRDDFKRVQEAVAPGIAAAKGNGFAEGVSGFYDPGGKVVYLWDAEGTRGEVHPSTALHETTHFLNHVLAQATGVHFPVWFEEGTAVYFQTWTPGVEEPEPQLASLASVIGWLRAGTRRTNRALRSVSYAEYRSDEYAWGWSLVRFLRRGKKGTLWAPLLEQMKALSGSAPTDGENRRFLRALGYGSDEAFDEDWYAHILALEPEEKTPLGTSKETLAAVAAVKKPTPEQATLLARLGRSFAASGMSEPAAVYLAAALRGGRDAVDLHLLLAEALAANAGRDEDEAWPDDAFGHLERAAAIDPLSAMVRLGLGRQMLLRAKSKDDVAAARDVLGLGLILLGPADDAKALARWALEATLRSEPDLTPSNALARLEAAAPVATGALRSAWIASLQEREAWNVLLQELGARLEAGTADFEERVTLAGLFEASDQAERAAPLYRALLDERPAATYLWPRLVRALVAARRLDEAKAAKARALRILAEAPSLAPLRRTVERIRIR